jgi:hypothetical protein
LRELHWNSLDKVKIKRAFINHSELRTHVQRIYIHTEDLREVLAAGDPKLHSWKENLDIIVFENAKTLELNLHAVQNGLELIKMIVKAIPNLWYLVLSSVTAEELLEKMKPLHEKLKLKGLSLRLSCHNPEMNVELPEVRNFSLL